MNIIADLHIHGKYSQGCSRNITPELLEKYARIKGINLLGTGDFTHPKWFNEELSKLEENNGILSSKTGFNFIWQTEISLIYTQEKCRKVHNIILAPNKEIVQQITEYLLSKGRIDYDGRPIFKIPCPEFVESLRSISPKIEVIPAHIWTPYFSMFGSKSGFDSVEECFQDQTKHINAFETGISSDPAMNWRIPSLDKLNILSFSDAHSYWPWRLGREATEFDLKKLSYDSILKAIRTGEGIKQTIEVDPNYGKYHADGHRSCLFCSNPKNTQKLNGICPVCKKPLIIGVWNRVEELAERPEGYKPKNAKPFTSLIPLSDILGLMLQTSNTTKKVWTEYYKLIEGKSEFEILMNTSLEELEKLTDPKIAKAIIQARNGEIKILPGYDGVYGLPLFQGITKERQDKEANRLSRSDKKAELKKQKLKQEKNKNQKSICDF